jgi:hypothetical protein
MRKAILAGALGLMMCAGLLMTQNANAYDGTSCDGANIAGPVYGPGGNEVVCVDGVGAPGFDGGALIAGQDGSSGRLCVANMAFGNPLPVAYVGLDGDNANTANLSGYGAISTSETGGTQDCNQGGGGSGRNSGGSFGSDLAPGVQLPLPFACGFTSGPNFDNTTRDGCYIP